MFKCGPTEDGETTSYGYDAASQLTSEVRPGYSAGYTFDGNGNRLSKAVNGVTEFYSYDDGDKLLSAGIKTYTYDQAGRTTAVKVGIGAPSILTYDDEDRLKTFMGQTYTYNGFDTRVGKNGTTYHRDGTGVTAPLISDSGATYTPGVSERRNGVSTFLNSGLKDVAKQTDAAGSVTATRKYDAYGMVIGSTGAWKGPFGYSGSAGYQEDETGLQLLGHRYYDSSTGRFITRDPIKAGRNWYGYCENNPVNRIDADGLDLTVVGNTIGVDGFTWALDLFYSRPGKRMNQPTKKQLMEEMIEAEGTVVLWGHGRDGMFQINDNEFLTADDLATIAAERKKRGKKKLGNIYFRCCDTCHDKNFVNAALELSSNVFGYTTWTSDGPLRHWSTPLTQNPKIEFFPWGNRGTGSKKKGGKSYKEVVKKG